MKYIILCAYYMNRLPHRWMKSITDADVSDNTKKTYLRNARIIVGLADGRPLDDIIKHPGTMKRRIAEAYPSLQTQKSFVATMKAIYKYNPELREMYPAQYDAWGQQFRELDKKINDRVATAQPTEREVLNWVDWNDVLLKQQELGRTDYGSTDHLLMSMHSLIEPVRADFGNICLVEADTPRDSDHDYVVLSPEPNRSLLVLNTYKTCRKYGTFSRTLPESLVHIIRESVNKNPRSYLFVAENGQPYGKKNSYTRFANRAFERIFGKRCTITLLRHSFISNIDFNETTPAELIKCSKNMMHSIEMQQLYRRKIPSLNVTRDERRPLTIHRPRPTTPPPTNHQDGSERYVYV